MDVHKLKTSTRVYEHEGKDVVLYIKSFVIVVADVDGGVERPEIITSGNQLLDFPRKDKWTIYYNYY